MRDVWEKIVNEAGDATTIVTQAAEKGIHFLRSNLGKLPLFASTHADVNERTERDETHYWLVPFRCDESGYALFTIRSLPPGIGPNNSLEKARIFHLHAPSGVDVLTGMIISRRKRELAGDGEIESDFADQLDAVARKIDKAGSAATLGLIIVGGAACFVNPVIGAAILAKGLIPSLGTIATASGLKYVGTKIRKTADSIKGRRAEKTAASEARTLQPEIRINPVLTELESLLETDPSHSDHLERASLDAWVETLGSVEEFRLTANAIASVYEEELARKKSSLRDIDRAWLEQVSELAAASG